MTPEITYLPDGMGNMAQRLGAKSGGMADVSASLVAALFRLGADVHVALPNYRRLFGVEVHRLLDRELRRYKTHLSDSRVHLAEDRTFYYREQVDSYGGGDSVAVSLAFQREVVNYILPVVTPDLVHCNDWMTGLIPAAARRMGIPALFTVHNVHTQRLTMAELENAGIDIPEFWERLYLDRFPRSYEESRQGNPVDLLVSGVFAAHYVNTVSPAFLDELIAGRHAFAGEPLRRELANKAESGCARGILNAPDPAFDPRSDESIAQPYSEDDVLAGKRANKRWLQARLGLEVRGEVPLFFWASRLDPSQKGCGLFAEILPALVRDNAATGLQVAVIANGAYQRPLRDLVARHGLGRSVAVHDFDEGLSHAGYAAADFVLMPSRFEPCGLPQMIGALYGALPVAHDTGGLHDTVQHLDLARGAGNGFVFEVHDGAGLRWAVDRALEFHRLPDPARAAQLARIMRESRARFHHDVTARQYFELYETMLRRPLTLDRAPAAAWPGGSRP